MKAAAARERLEIEWQQLPIGKRGHEEHGHTLPAVTEQSLRELDGWVMGPIGHAAYPRNDPTWVMPPVRKKFDLFAAVKPALSHATVPSIHSNVDIVFLRELTEGMLYSDTVVAGAPGVPAQRRDYRRHARDHAQGLEPRGARGFRDRSHPQAQEGHRGAQGAGVPAGLRHVRGGMPQGGARVSGRGVRGDDGRLISMKLVIEPQQFDVVVTTNQFGDILTDIGAGLVGGLGLAPGLCVGERQAMAQATHGSAPDIAGRNIANPYAMIVSGQMLLAWLGRKRGEPKATAAANRIHAAVNTVIAAGKHLTRDLGGKPAPRRWETRSPQPCKDREPTSHATPE